MTHVSCENVTVKKHRNLGSGYHNLVLGPYPHSAECRPGNFVHIQIPNGKVFFRRAMSIAAVDPKRKELEIIFKVLGRGTTLMTKINSGDMLNIMGPLGKPFAFPQKDETIIMIGGGVGFPPLMYLSHTLIAKKFKSKNIEFFYGGKTSGEIVERVRIKKLGVSFHPTTDDGSFGIKGVVTKAVEKYLKDNPGRKFRIYSCGPDPMLKAVNELALNHHIPGQLSLEAPMPCGVGICLGCVVPLTNGDYARVCCEGPVFNIGEVKL